MREYRLTHLTKYTYSLPVAVSRHVCYLRPLTTPTQEVVHHRLSIHPHPMEELERIDYFGNHQFHFQIEEQHSVLDVTAESQVRINPGERSKRDSTITCEQVRRRMDSDTGKESLQACLMACPSLFTKCGQPLRAFAEEHIKPRRPYLQAALALNASIHESFGFDREATDVGTPADEVFEHRRGVCQDFAHLMLACLRSQRLPARYVSGYILTQPPEGQPRLQGADASHAWVSVWIPDLGWIDLDPTNNIVCGEEHITVARGRDYADVNPLRGAVTGGGEQAIEIAVTVNPFEEVAVSLCGRIASMCPST